MTFSAKIQHFLGVRNQPCNCLQMVQMPYGTTVGGQTPYGMAFIPAPIQTPGEWPHRHTVRHLVLQMPNGMADAVWYGANSIVLLIFQTVIYFWKIVERNL
jgi:hypothetical protein